MEIKAGEKFKCIESVIENKGSAVFYIEGKIYISEADGRITDEQGEVAHWWVDTETMEPIPSFSKYFKPLSEIKTPNYYDNSKGSLYKIANQRKWNAYVFDIVKRLERGGKKDPLKQEIEKSIVVLQIWLSEL